MGRFVQLPFIAGNISSGIDKHTMLMLHGEDFTDSSSYNRTIENVGNVVIDEGKFNKGFYFTRERRLYLNLSQDDPLLFADKDFTIDFWCLIRDNVTSNCIITYSGQTYTQLGLVLEPVAGLRLYIGNHQNNGYPFNIILGTRPDYNKWYHYAIVRKKERLLFFMNGELISETNIGSYSIVPASFLTITHFSKSGDNTYGINGCIDELRISDIARWTSNFTPSIEPYR